jgi:hypothetical protein
VATRAVATAEVEMVAAVKEAVLEEDRAVETVEVMAVVTAAAMVEVKAGGMVADMVVAATEAAREEVAMGAEREGVEKAVARVAAT